MKDFAIVTPPDGATFDQAEVEDLIERIQPLLVAQKGCAICTRDLVKNIEHLPPKSSGNVTPLDTIIIDSEASRRTGELTFVAGESMPFRYRNSLCQKCNKRTGVWYASDYRDFSAAAESRIGAGTSISIASTSPAAKPSRWRASMTASTDG